MSGPSHRRVLTAIAVLSIVAAGAAWSGCGDDAADQALEDVQQEIDDAQQEIDDAVEATGEKSEELRSELDDALDAAQDGDEEGVREALERAAEEGGDRAQEAIDVAAREIQQALDAARD